MMNAMDRTAIVTFNRRKPYDRIREILRQQELPKAVNKNYHVVMGKKTGQHSISKTSLDQIREILRQQELPKAVNKNYHVVMGKKTGQHFISKTSFRSDQRDS
jgi:hypothetical protein